MFNYNFQENLSLEDLNYLGDEGWEVVKLLINESPANFDAFLKKGFQDKTLIVDTESGSNFWIEKTVDYGDVFIIFFGVVVFIAIIGKSIYKFLYE
jgi:hypothetical protein